MAAVAAKLNIKAGQRADHVVDAAKLMIQRGAQPVRQVAIDEVWSALRFRPGD